MKATGVLKRINAKHGSSTKGPWTAYSLCVGPAGNDDSDVWFRYGFDAPKVAEGSVVMFEYNEDGNGNKKVSGDIMVDKSATAKVAKTGGGGGGISNDARQASIVRQNATTTGTAIVKLMLDLDILTLPKTKADRYDFVLESIHEVANHLYPTLMLPPSIEEIAERGIEVEDVPEDDLDKAFESGDDDKWTAV